MKRNLLIAASVAAMAAFTAPSFAESPAQSKDQDSTGQTQINPAAQQLNAESDTGTDMTTTASINSVDTLVPVMATGTTVAGQVQTIKQVSNVKVVRVNDWASANKQAWDAAMSQNMRPVNDLRAALTANTVVSARLAEQQVMPSNVVASQIQPDGSMVVYVYDGA
ncbi:hypothetical protein KEU06_11335 [Pseudaminobacter sp. 19-2017]|uniref:Uncharacterized protein n=1 Tax=Pseudaminobacter soli (ex Zhang et al. 2022) TaxID=2831468 RepID=A0A942DXD8_9HYPH|nr:hypothetical protein [Pseudaminobacter soli]MBS3649201.1 hypothetical protein [Pseudaminobacter soli]